MEIIILAAGQGRRLLPHTEHFPKAMISPGGAPPLIGATVEALAGHEAVRRIAVVGGYRYEVLRDYLERLGLAKVAAIRNDAFDREGPQASILKGLGAEGQGGVVVMNGDTWFDPALLRFVLDRCRAGAGAMTLFGSCVEAVGDDIKIALDVSGGVRAVGKHVSLDIAGAISCGIFHCRDAPAVEALRQAMHDSLAAAEGTWHGALNRAIAGGWRIGFEELPSDAWLEIDTPADLEILAMRRSA